MYQVGQGILGKIMFRDGIMPQYNRTYLIVGVDNNNISVLNVSSIQGKENKVMYRTNHVLNNYNPPFRKPSFVKLDSLTVVSESYVNSNCRLLSNGQPLLYSELNTIIHMVT